MLQLLARFWFLVLMTMMRRLLRLREMLTLMVLWWEEGSCWFFEVWHLLFVISYLYRDDVSIRVEFRDMMISFLPSWKKGSVETYLCSLLASSQFYHATFCL